MGFSISAKSGNIWSRLGCQWEQFDVGDERSELLAPAPGRGPLLVGLFPIDVGVAEGWDGWLDSSVDLAAEGLQREEGQVDVTFTLVKGTLPEKKGS